MGMKMYLDGEGMFRFKINIQMRIEYVTDQLPIGGRSVPYRWPTGYVILTPY